MTLWELRYKVESHVQVWYVVVLALIAALFGIFGFLKGKGY